MHHETADPLKTEPGFGLGVPRRHRQGVAWCESGAGPGKLRRCIAREMRYGAFKWRTRCDRRTRDAETLWDKLRSVGVFCSLFEIGGGQLFSHSLVGVSFFRTVQCRFRASLFRLVGDTAVVRPTAKKFVRTIAVPAPF
jgi:hypothetical protein